MFINIYLSAYSVDKAITPNVPGRWWGECCHCSCSDAAGGRTGDAQHHGAGPLPLQHLGHGPLCPPAAGTVRGILFQRGGWV